MNRTSSLIITALFCAVIAVATNAQSPAPVVVRAATEMTPAPKTAVASTDDSTGAAIKALEELKAANAETLKKQEATLSQLDELQKAADQLKIFAKRG